MRCKQGLEGGKSPKSEIIKNPHFVSIYLLFMV